ncbi:unnamed protein product [Allacma fusca]|uniref:Alpha-1,3-glucosyltransferase n=1 Tax=Allacma fusca TaxID=39272 RepID=A0A8J2P2H1_9HEXA|nr:unnamed protein product [Allacma fusca]
MTSINYWGVVAATSVFKLLLINSYRSTDFEVHRNWLAITHSLPLEKWYHEETSEWTLDYPPFFAYFEWILSFGAAAFDKNMLDVSNLNYNSSMTILFQKLSVIVCDLVLAAGVLNVVKALVGKTKSADIHETKLRLLVLIFLNGGLFIIDHIHFQYNGFLYGILLLSISKILEEKIIEGALLFSMLLNLKHIYLYIAPAFGCYLFRKYCIIIDRRIPQINIKNLLSLGFTVVAVFAASFGPFYRHIPQIISRLFPFKRGLCHAYWAPNIWALYNTVDLGANFVLKKGRSSITSGLVGESLMAVLPQVQPFHTFVLTLIFMLPSMIKILWQPSRSNFVNGIILTAWTSFIFGYHVHEKAILNVVIPFALVSFAEPKLFFITLISGTFSIFPLLFTPFEVIFKLLFCSLHFVLSYSILPAIKFRWFEKLYLLGFVPLFLIENVGPYILPKYPFLPLIVVSDYCFISIFVCYVIFYWNCLTKDEIHWTITSKSAKEVKRKKKY